MLSRQHQLLAVAVMAALSLSACGKKKDLVSGEKPASQAQTEEKKKDESATMQNRQPGLGGGLEEGTAELPTTPSQKGPQNLGGANLPPPPAAPSAKRPQTPAQQQPSHTPSLPQQSQNLPQRQQDDDGDQRQERQQPQQQVEMNNRSGLHLTGGRAAGGLFYTSAGNDDVHEALRARNERVDENSRRLNLAAASAVTSARLDMSGDSALLTLKINEAGGEQIYRLNGAMGGSLRVARGSTGSQPVEGTLQCLDADQNGLCENMFARLKVGANGSSGIVNVIFRQSNANPYFKLPGQRSGNPDYETIRDFIRSAILGTDTRNKIRSSRFNSWEVTNGRSGFTVMLQTMSGETIAYAGPLLASLKGGQVNAALTRVDEGGRSNYANLLGSAQLVSNDGAGKIQVSISTRPSRQYDRDTFLVNFTKDQKAVIDLR